MYYTVIYSGIFGFIKPWTAVRDSTTFSQQFLTPSIVEGIEKKLFPELLLDSGKISKIIRHKLIYSSISVQQEQTQSRGWVNKKQTTTMVRNQSILGRGVMLNPVLTLAFNNETDAQRAATQHICLCRNEDVLFPIGDAEPMTEDGFNQLAGFELCFGENEKSFLVGFNRFDEVKPMFGRLEITGKPVLGM